MSETSTPAAPVSIRAIRFFTKYIPRRPTEENPKPAVDDIVPEDWVAYCGPGQAQSNVIEDAVHRLQRDKSGKWDAIEQAYNFWKRGEQAPTSGTPLAAWAGINSAQADVLKASGLRTVEEVAEMNDSLMARIRLPSPRTLKENANRYLEARKGSEAETALKERDERIAQMEAQIQQLLELAEANTDEPAKNKGGRPRKDQQAAA